MLFIFTFVVLLAGAAVAHAGWRLWLAYSSRYWPRVTGQVIRSSYANSPEPSDLTTHRVAVTYEYFVDGTRHTSDILTIGAARYLPHHSAKETALRYTPGTIVTVRYHPRRPRLAVLNGGQFGYALLNLAVVVLMLTVALATLYHWVQAV